MKKLRLIVAFVLIVSLVMPIKISSAAAVYALDEESVDDKNTTSKTIISNDLKSVIAEATGEERIPVTIELKDSIDLDAIEEQAIKQANITAEEHAILNADTTKLCDKENQAHQLASLAIRDRIYAERNAILKEYYTKKNEDFVSDSGLIEEKIGSIGIFTPFIRKVLLTCEQIKMLENHPEVRAIYYAHEDECIEFVPVVQPASTPSINETYQIVNGDVCLNSGYTGNGIKVGLVETGHPNLSAMGDDGNNITRTGTDTNSTTIHATMTSGIIKKFAPNCEIFSRTASDNDWAVLACQYLVEQKNVHVLNISFGVDNTSEYNYYSRELDILARNNKVTIIVAAGNNGNGINPLGMAPNVITVGAVVSSGIDQAAPGAYSRYTDSSYIEAIRAVNKPEVCAPGVVEIYGYEAHGTSFAAPHVTGTVVQMMSRNVGLSNKPETLKAILMASASYNTGSTVEYIMGSAEVSNEEGAGVIDAGFCFQVASNGRRTHFDATANADSFSHNIYCDTTAVPFRVACAWEVISNNYVEGDPQSEGEVGITDYDMYIYKNGEYVASSTARSNAASRKNTNYEVIEISLEDLAEFGAGYYQVKIVRYGQYYHGNESIRIGLAWEQR